MLIDNASPKSLHFFKVATFTPKIKRSAIPTRQYDSQKDKISRNFCFEKGGQPM